ncbi:MAG: carboxypeptidase M32, partial [Phycisphaerae bacterium]
SFSPNDVRITTRYDARWFPGSFFGCLHEMGHAFYEMNVNPAFETTPLGGGVSLGIHESQSRLWENLVGRSAAFWGHYYPELQKVFPSQFGGVALAQFYVAINRVAPSLIRVEADEVTYNLHIILRYEMEQELLEGRLSVADAPAAWNARMQSYLGLTPPTDREGISQDVHWSGGGIGYFPTYTLGNILATQFYEAAAKQHPTLPDEISRGQFGTLRGWLRQNVHQFGRKYKPVDLVTRATGRPLETGPYVAYLKRKFGEVYGL